MGPGLFLRHQTPQRSPRRTRPWFTVSRVTLYGHQPFAHGSPYRVPSTVTIPQRDLVGGQFHLRLSTRHVTSTVPFRGQRPPSTVNPPICLNGPASGSMPGSRKRNEQQHLRATGGANAHRFAHPALYPRCRYPATPMLPHVRNQGIGTLRRKITILLRNHLA